MSEELDNRAEILKLARLLGREADELGYLKAIPSGDIRILREQMTEVLFTAHGHALGRLAAGSKILPVGLVASLGEHVFGPVLSARVAGLLEPSRAVEMASKLPIPFLAEIAIELDPRRATDVIAQIPPAQVAAISRELTRREEYVTMGRFVGHLGPEAIRAAIEAVDDRSLLQIAFVLEEKQALVKVADTLGLDKLQSLIDAAAGSDLQEEATDLLNHLSDAQRANLAESAAARGDDELVKLLAQAGR